MKSGIREKKKKGRKRRKKNSKVKIEGRMNEIDEIMKRLKIMGEMIYERKEEKNKIGM